MKLLRHLLSHMLLILVLFGIVSVYYYRHQILPDSYAQQINTYAERIHPTLASFSRTKQIVVVEQASDVKPQQMEEQKQLTEDVVVSEKAAVEGNDVAEVNAQKVDVAKIESGEVSSESSVALTDVPAAEDTKESVDTTASIERNENPGIKLDGTASKDEVESGVEQSISTDKEAASEDALLKVARIAYHEGNPLVAIKIYKELIELEDNEADYFGELGNVYYAIGKWDLAGMAYYEAATRLIEQNQFAQVNYLQRVIQGLNVEQAEKLANQLAKANQ